MIGGHHVCPQHQVALPPLRLVERTNRGGLLRSERDVESRCGAHVDQARIHGGTGAIDHHGVGGRLDVRAHGVNQPVPDDDGARRHRRARHRDQPGAFDRVDVRGVGAKREAPADRDRDDRQAESNRPRHWSFSPIVCVVCGLRSVHVFLIERKLLVVEPYVASFDHHSGHVRPDLERIAFGHEEVGVFAGLEASDAIGDAEDLGGADGERLQRLLTIEPQATDIAAWYGRFRAYAASLVANANFTPAFASSPASW